MSAKLILVLMSATAVVGDSLLHPFYPQYLERAFGLVDPLQVGLYIAGCSLTVLSCLPLWSLIAQRIPVLHLLVATQLIAAALSLACSATASLPWFCVLSFSMLAFKASYLLIYPYLMSLEGRQEHLSTISLLAFVVYFGNILAALLSGTMLQLLDPRSLFVAMAAGDLLQIALCVYLIVRSAVPTEPPQAETSGAPALPREVVLKLGSVMLVLYFSAYLSEPFFASYWQDVSQLQSETVSGLVFAIPGVTALVGLYINVKRGSEAAHAYAGILPALALALCSLWLQASGALILIVLGRFAFGWALFQAMVRLDALIFSQSNQSAYASDFSKLNLFQGLGVLTASFSAGSIVSMFGPKLTFIVASGGFLAGAILFGVLFRQQLWPRERSLQTEENVT